MREIDIDDAKARLAELVDQAARGDGFVITRSGKPLVQVTTCETSRLSKFGFMRGQMKVPEDFDRLAQDEIEKLFGMKR